MDELKPINVLVSLHKGYGLGDAVQMSAVLRHIKRHRPHWVVDFQAERGQEKVGRGIANSIFCYGEPYPSSHYDAEVQLVLFDRWDRWIYRPNTRVSSCLHDCFNMSWDAECGRYQVEISPQAMSAAEVLVSPGSKSYTGLNSRVVAIHYQGDSVPAKKNLSHDQAAAICKCVEKLGGTPLLIDWRNISPLPSAYSIRTTCGIPPSRGWGADAEMNCAVIAQCAAFVGIDSGPAKCASATDTPSLVVWTGHHPAQFHDPAPNTTHLVPHGYHSLEPVCNDPGVVMWFEDHYRVRQYDHNPVDKVVMWLKEVIG